MIIKIYPDDIVRLCLWGNYAYYIVGSEKEAEKILKENKEFELSERDALVIGLLKIIETNNLIHKFNNYITEQLFNKSIKEKDILLIKKKTFDAAFDKFLDKFPSYWEPSSIWVKSLKELREYIHLMKDDISKLEIYNVVDKNINIEFYNSNHIKKLLKFQY